VTTTLAEPEWDEQTRAEAMALAVYQSTLCPVCGGPTAECQDPGTEDVWLPDLPIRCNKRVAYNQAEKPYSDDPNASALAYSIRHRNDIEAAKRYAEATAPRTEGGGES
jgi:hypothetical protein